MSRHLQTGKGRATLRRLSSTVSHTHQDEEKKATIINNIRIMDTKFRKSPPVCLLDSLGRLLIGKLRLSSHYHGDQIKMEDGQEFTIFRHIFRFPVRKTEHPITFIVSFKFGRFSHNGNRIISIIPMMLIAGFPGFQTKMYAVNEANGFWQGMDQWKTQMHLEAYLQSFVYKMMNKRALKETLSSETHDDQFLRDNIDKNKVS